MASRERGYYNPRRVLYRASAPTQVVDLLCPAATDCTLVFMRGRLVMPMPCLPGLKLARRRWSQQTIDKPFGKE